MRSPLTLRLEGWAAKALAVALSAAAFAQALNPVLDFSLKVKALLADNEPVASASAQAQSSAQATLGGIYIGCPDSVVRVAERGQTEPRPASGAHAKTQPRRSRPTLKEVIENLQRRVAEFTQCRAEWPGDV